MARKIRVRVKNGMDWEYLTIDLDELEDKRVVKGETDMYWPFIAELWEE